MIVKHKSIVRSQKIINSIVDLANKKQNLDGVIEYFNDKDKQGFVLKLYNTFDDEVDKCIWVYEDLLQNKIIVINGTHSNCTEYNNFDNNAMVFGKYDIDSSVIQTVSNDVINYIYKEYEKVHKI